MTNIIIFLLGNNDSVVLKCVDSISRADILLRKSVSGALHYLGDKMSGKNQVYR